MCSHRLPMCPVKVTGVATQLAAMCFFSFSASHLLISKLWTSELSTYKSCLAQSYISVFLKELSVGHFCCTYKDLAFLRSILDYEDIWRIFWDVFVVGLFGRFKRCCRSTFWSEKGDLNQVMTWAWPGFMRLRPTWTASQIPRNLRDVLMALGAFFVHEWLPFPSMAVFLDESAWAEKRFHLSIRRHFRDTNGQDISSCFLCRYFSSEVTDWA